MYVSWKTISRNKKKGLVRNKMYVLDVFTPKSKDGSCFVYSFLRLSNCAG